MQKYAAAGIQIKIDDAQNIGRLFPGQSFDVIASVFTAEHMADPWALFQGMYEKLDEEGGLFICNFPYNLTSKTDERYVRAYLRSHYGATARVRPTDSHSWVYGDNIAVQKRGQGLRLPLDYFDVSSKNGIDVISYQFNPNALFEPL